MSTDRVMLLIDADNVSVDVMEQAVRLLMNQHGGVHLRRAYCTAESAVANQAAFKRLGIKPMVNLAAGKNSTDIALAVDAIDLVLAERPDVVAIASSDSDFAPLVQRLREKGCVVRGIGQFGKVGQETQDVYDDFTVLEHRKGSGSSAASSPRTRARTAAPRKTTAPRKTVKEAVKEPLKTRKTAAAAPAKLAPASAALAAPDAEPSAPAAAAAVAAAPAAAAARKKPARKRSTAAAKTPAVAAAPTAAPRIEPGVAPRVEPRVEPRITPGIPPGVAPVPQPAPPEPLLHEKARRILACMPELERRETLELRVASQRLREADLLGKSGSSTKLLGQFPELFELLPPGQPNHVRMRA